KPKDEKKPESPKEQYDALVKEFNNQRGELMKEIQKLKGPEQQKVIQKYLGAGREFAEKFYKLAEENPKDAVATDALFWIVQNGAGSDVHQKALKKLTPIVQEMPAKDLDSRLKRIMVRDAGFAQLVYDRAEKEEKDADAAGNLLVWVATTGSYFLAGEKAAIRLAEKYPDNPGLERVCMVIGQGGGPQAADTLKQILEKSDKPAVKAAAALGLGRQLAAKADTLGDKLAEADKVAGEAERYFVMVVDQFGKENAARKAEAEHELKALRTLRVGKE